MDSHAEHSALIDDLTRRGFLQRAGVLGAGALVLAAGPVARDLIAAQPAQAAPPFPDATFQAFADTMIPGRPATRTDLGNEIDPRAIAGVDNRPGAVEADALALSHHPLIGFDALATPFLTELESRALQVGGDFLGLSFEKRVQVCIQGLDFKNPTRLLWEAAAAVPFTAFCAAGVVPEQTAAKASGYRVMGLPGAAPQGYRRTSYRRKLSRERTRKGYLP
jgi:enediyne biosynthesis protein E8